MMRLEWSPDALDDPDAIYDAISMDNENAAGQFIDKIRAKLCHKALRCRHERLLGTTSDVAPILWQHGALARLDKGKKIDRLLYNGYSTISLFLKSHAKIE